jgi:sulfonate transport system ATP-binding protein
MSQVRAEQLCFRYAPGAALTLHPLDLDLPLGQRIALIGRSGCGKSTLARLLTGHLRPSGGALTVDGLPPHLHPGVQLLPQDPHQLLPPGVPLHLLVSESLLAHGRPADADAVHALLGAVGLAARRGATATQLSGGEQRRAALARLLAAQPRLVVADELTSGLDAHLRPQIVQTLLAALGPACTVVLVTHDLQLAARTCARLLVLDGGRLVDDLDPTARPDAAHPATEALWRASRAAGVVR